MAVTVTVDDREPAAVAAALREHPDVTAVDVVRLDAGDLVAGDVGFERKTCGDYLNSTLARTGSDLEAQALRLADSYTHAYVLLEGTLAELENCWSNVSPASVRGSVASITARTGVPVLPCGDLDRLVDVAVRLVRKHTEAPSTRPLDAGAVTARREPVTKRIYGCIDGIGPTTATALYEAFPTVESLVAASIAEIEAVEGIGPERAAAIEEALRGGG